MTEHAELLAEARELAVRVEDDLHPGGDNAANLILALIDLVEGYAKSEAALPVSEHVELLKDAQGLAKKADTASEGFTAWTLRTLAGLVKQQDEVIAETVAACVSCDREMTRVLGLYEDKYGIWNDVSAARHRARCAVKLAGPIAKVETNDPIRDKLVAACKAAERAAKLGKPEGGVDTPCTLCGSGSLGEQYKAHEWEWLTGPPGFPSVARTVHLCNHCVTVMKLGRPPVHRKSDTTNQAEPPGYSEFRDRAKAVVEAGAKVSREEALAMIDAECTPEHGERTAPQTLPPGVFPPVQEPPFVLEDDCPAPPVEEHVPVTKEVDSFPVGSCLTPPLGLYDKFKVRRTDGDPTGKHIDCEYFVLDLTHDPHARVAIRAYMASCAIDRPELAADIDINWPASPVKVEMRVVPTTHGHKWEWRFGTEPWMTVVTQQRIYSATPALAQAHGNAWLAALGKQLGVKLVANWEEGE